MKDFNFGGWATRNDLLCGDGRTIRKNAFKDNDGQTVPLVWNHDHTNPDAVLGHALLENREEGVYAHCRFNDTESGQHAKMLVENGDVRSLSIYANKLKQIGGDVVHGCIRELSLVLAGANPGAYIDYVVAHGDDEDDSAYINYDENAIALYHSEPQESEKNKESDKEKNTMAENKNEKTVEEVFNELTEEQKNVVYALIGQAIEDAQSENEESQGGNDNMKHNIFDKETENENVLSHAEIETIFKDAKRLGSLKEAVLAHSTDTEDAGALEAYANQAYGVKGADYLFPDAQTINGVPQFIQREMGWVQKVMKAVHRTPFSRIKSIFANITEDEARAKGYIKGKQKKDEVFALLKRTTTPTTIYKKQKLDRDDVADIADFDVVAWLKAEMRMMLDEEIARAVLIGDGRNPSLDDKINEQNIRPIWTDEDLYTIKKTVEAAGDESLSKAFIKAAIRARKDYKGSGEPTLYTTEDVLTECLLLEDSTGRVIYDSVSKLASTLRVKEIVTVPVFEGATRDDKGTTKELMGLIVNLADYNVGADKGGAVNMFDDFDIDYNQQKYLIETRCSGALIKPYSAIALEVVKQA